MLAEALKVTVLFVMKNHVYKCDGKIRKQRNGGPIGLELTGDLAQVMMIWYDEQLKERVSQAGHAIRLYTRYVDDITMALRNDWNKPEVEENSMDDSRALEKVKDIGNQIHGSIQLTGDAPSLHEDKKLPTLDLKIWAENRDNTPGSVIVHEFYAKEVSAKHITHARSAMPSATRRRILTQELVRELLRCSPLLEWEKVTTHMNAMMRRMQFSGYGQAYRTQILKSALSAYDSICEKDANGEVPMYRPKEWKRESREAEKRQRKENLFKKGGTETVIFVPNTPQSKLKNLYLDEIRKTGMNIKVVEGAGKSIKRILQKSDPFHTSDCVPPYTDNCPVCMSGNGKCRKEGVTYKITCDSCSEIYIGETADNAYTRGCQHAYALKTKSKDSVLHKHVQNAHSTDPPPTFSMAVTGIFSNDALLRQVTEGNAINNNSKHCMNSRAEWNHQSIPRIILADD